MKTPAKQKPTNPSPIDATKTNKGPKSSRSQTKREKEFKAAGSTAQVKETLKKPEAKKAAKKGVADLKEAFKEAKGARMVKKSEVDIEIEHAEAGLKDFKAQLQSYDDDIGKLFNDPDGPRVTKEMITIYEDRLKKAKLAKSKAGIKKGIGDDSFDAKAGKQRDAIVQLQKDLESLLGSE